MLKKLICFMALITFCAFSGCSESSQNENIELEDAPWGITMEDVFETYGVNKDTVENLIEMTLILLWKTDRRCLVKRHLKFISAL